MSALSGSNETFMCMLFGPSTLTHHPFAVAVKNENIYFITRQKKIKERILGKGLKTILTFGNRTIDYIKLV